MTRKGYIYRLTIKDRFYFGRTMQEPQARFWHHRGYLRSGKHCNKYLQNMFNKYGEEELKFEIIASCTDCNFLDQVEQFYISKFIDEPNCMNISRWADAIVRLGDFTDEHKKKISESKKGPGNAMYGKIGAASHRSKKVIAILPDDTVSVWASAREAARELGILPSSIGNYCLNKSKPTNNYKEWRFSYA